MTTVANDHVLSAYDLKALRQADSVSFHFCDGKGLITGHKRLRNPGPYAGREESYDIAVESEFFSTRGVKPNSFTMFHSAKYNDVWPTVVRNLKKGDKLILVWCADHFTNGYLGCARVGPTDRKGDPHCGAGMILHADALYLKVVRGNLRLQFLLDVSVCVDNTARMIRL